MNVIKVKGKTKRFKGILVEVSLTELYENQKTWLYIIQKIESLGFKIWDF